MMLNLKITPLATFDRGNLIFKAKLIGRPKHYAIFSFCFLPQFFNGPFSASSFLNFVFQQLTVNKYSIKVADGWIRTRGLLYHHFCCHFQYKRTRVRIQPSTTFIEYGCATTTAPIFGRTFERFFRRWAKTFFLEGDFTDFKSGLTVKRENDLSNN